MLTLIDKDRLRVQLKADEGFSPVAFWDNKQWTFGYGCKAQKEGDTISESEADILLRVRLEQSIGEFETMFKGHLQKFNDVRAEAFINILFNIGIGKKDGSTGGLYSFKNTLKLIFDNPEVPWITVSSHLAHSLWFRQVGKRAERIVREVKTGVKDVVQ